MTFVSRARHRTVRRAVAAALLAGTIAWSACLAVGVGWLSRERERQFTRFVERLETSLALEAETARSRVAAAAEQAARAVERRVAAGALAPGIDRAVASELRGDQTWVEVVDAAGTVLSAAPWPERLGLRGRWLVPGAGPDRPVTLPTLDGDRDVWVGRASIAGPDGVSLASVVVAAIPALPDLPDDPWAPSRLTWHLPDGTTLLRSAVTASAPGTRESPWREVVLNADLPGTVIAVWAVAPDEAAAGRLTSGLFLAGLIALVPALLTGWWVGRRAASSIGGLMDAAEAVLQGEADFTFDHRPGDELEELRAELSRLARSHDRERRRARTAERAGAWQDVARRVAHEVKNPLAPIRLTVQNLRRARERAPDRFDEMFERGADTILEEVNRLDRLVKEFSEFARLPAPRRRPCSLVELVTEIADLHRGGGVDVAVTVLGDPCPVPLDRDQASRAVGNLVGNAVEAQAGSEAIAVVITVRFDDRWAVVEVADRGEGFADGALARAFEPEFTTKVSGSGLGLAIVQRIVADHGGFAEAAERSGGGAVVRLGWPLAPEDAGVDPAE